MTVEEAGRKCGLKTSKTHGPEFYSEYGSRAVRGFTDLFKKEKSMKRNDKLVFLNLICLEFQVK